MFMQTKRPLPHSVNGFIVINGFKQSRDASQTTVFQIEQLHNEGLESLLQVTTAYRCLIYRVGQKNRTILKSV